MYEYFEKDFVLYSDIWLERPNELEIENFWKMKKPALNFVKLILAKSPRLKKVTIFLHSNVSTDKELHMLKTFISSPRASPVVEIISDGGFRFKYSPFYYI